MFAVLASWFVFGSFLYWGVTGLAVILLFIAIEKDAPFWAGFEVIVYLAFLQWLAKIDVIGFVQEKPLLILPMVLGYFLIGIVWSVAKWWLYVRRRVNEYCLARKEYLERHGIENADINTQIPDNLRAEWNRHAPFSSKNAPKASDKKSTITGWIMYWPISLIWSMIDDIIKQIVEEVVIKLQRLYQNISDKAYAGVNGDFDE